MNKSKSISVFNLEKLIYENGYKIKDLKNLKVFDTKNLLKAILPLISCYISQEKDEDFDKNGDFYIQVFCFLMKFVYDVSITP